MRRADTSDFTESLEYVYSLKMGVLAGASFIIFGVCFIVQQYGDLLVGRLSTVFLPH